MNRLINDYDTLRALQRVYDKLPGIVESLGKDLADLIKVLELAHDIDNELNNYAHYDIAAEVVDMISRGSPFNDAVRIVARARQITVHQVVSAYKVRYQGIKWYQQYMANLTAKLLIEAGYGKVQAKKVSKATFPQALLLESDFKDVADGQVESSFVPWRCQSAIAFLHKHEKLQVPLPPPTLSTRKKTKKEN